jgi:hypothetical protein
MESVGDILRSNLQDVEQRIVAACRRAGRSRDEVTLVSVTKYVSPEICRRLLELGVTNLGESRPQELWRKAQAVPEARWHLVGHLQRNKVEKTLPVVSMIHSVDSVRLLDAIEAEAGKADRACTVLIEFNLSGEPAKHGFAPADWGCLPPAIARCRHVRVVGLMTMAALESDAVAARATFAELRQLREQLQPHVPFSLSHLSMGMTNDFEVAIEEGATIVRIGSALFRGLQGAEL